jgi:hypothetical protein
MPELTLFFETAEGANLDATAAALQAKAKVLPHVEAASSDPMQYRSLGVPEIMMGITMGVALLQSGTMAVKGLTDLMDALKKLCDSVDGVKKAYVQIGLRKVPLDQPLTEADAKKLLATG